MVVRILADLLIAIGLIFAIAGTKGTLRMPDVFSRMQASTCIATMGILGAGLGALLYAIFVMHSASAAVKIAVIVLMIFVTNPIGSHAIMKGAYRAGFRPEKPMETDAFKEDFDE